MKAALNQKPGERQDNVTANGGNICANSPVYLINFARKFSISGITPQLKQFFFLGWIFFFPELIFSQAISVTNVTTTPVCAGSDVTVTFDVTNGSGASNYFTASTDFQFYFTDVTGATFNAIPGTFTIPASYSGIDGGITQNLSYDFTIPSGTSSGNNYKIAIGSTNPTFDASTGAGASPAFEVNATLPTVTSVTDGSNCGPGDVTLQAQASAGTIDWYSATAGGGAVAVGTTTYTPNLSASKDFYAEAVNKGCRSATRKLVKATIIPQVTPTVNITATATNICTSGSSSTPVTFSIASSANAGASPGYQWKLNNVAMPSETSSTYTSSSLANGDKVTLEMTSSATCPLPATATSNQITISANPNVTPTVNLSASATTICPGGNIIFSAAPTNGGVSPGYAWEIDGSPAGGNSASFSTSALTDGQTIKVTLTSNATCALPTTATDQVLITVNPGTPATPGSISGTTAVCPGTTGLSYSIPAVTNATTYTWTLPSGWTKTAGGTTNAITVTSGSSNGNITVTAGNSCGTSPASSLAVTVNPGTPSTPGTISGSGVVCPAISGLTYSISSVTGATSYNWTVPAGWSITGNTGTSITVTSGSAGTNGSISVTATNSCGTSAAKTLAVTVSPATPNTPGTITGASGNAVCPQTNATFSITSVSNASTYNWVPPTGWSIVSGQGTTSVTMLAGNYGQDGNISVTAGNSCGTSTPSIQALSVSPGKPAQPSVISGNTTQCPGLTGQLYSVTNDPTASSYTWTLPTGWTITSGSGTNSVTLTTGSTGQNGSITVTANNSCGISTSRTLAVIVANGAPATPSSITLPTGQICATGSGYVFSVPNDATATEYLWSFPSGWIIQGSAPYGNQVTVNTNAAVSGNVSVQAKNSCGTSSARTSSVSILTTVPPNPGSISGIAILCGPKTLSYSISSVAGATSYIWSVSGAAPSGNWSFTGQGTTSIAVTYPSSANPTSGTISVVASNGCVNSATPAQIPISIGSGFYVSAGPDEIVCTSTSGTSFTYTPSTSTISGYTGTGGNNLKKSDLAAPVLISGSGASASIGGNNGSNSPWDITYTLPRNTGSTPQVYKFEIANKQAYSDCGGASRILKDTVQVTVLPVPTASITGTATICSGSTSTITFTGTANTIVTYNVSGGISQTNQTINIGASGTAILTTPSLSATTTYTITNVAHQSLPSCSASATGSAVITVNPLATANAGPAQTVCSNATVQLAGAIGGSATSGAWSGGTGTYSPNANTLNAVYTPSIAERNAGSASLTLTASGPCPAVSSQIPITINQAPTVSAGSTLDMCQSATATSITLSGATVGGGATTGAWSITSGGGTLSTTAQNASPGAVAYSPVVNFTGMVTLTLTTNAPTGCTAVSATRTINVNSLPTVNPGADIDVCQSATPAPFALSGAGVGGGATTGAWSITSGGGTLSNTSQQNNPGIAATTYTPAANFTGTVELTLLSNAPAGCSAVSGVRTINVDPSPIVSAGATVDVCEPATPTAISLTNAGVSGGATTGTWSIVSGGGSLSNTNATSNPASVTYTPASNFAGQVVLKLTTDATGSCSPVSATKTINVTLAPTVTAGPNQTICSDGTATMAGSFGGGATLATWSSSGNGTFNNNSGTAVYTPGTVDKSAGTVTLTYSTDDPAGPCNAVSASMTLTINKATSISTQPANFSVCEGNPADISVVATGTSLSYQWYKGTAPSGVAMSNSANISGAQTNKLHFASTALADNGSYYVVITSASPCAAVTSNTVSLNVNKGITISTQPSDQIVCQGSNVSFTVVADADGAALSYQWRKNNADISGANSASLVINAVAPGDAGTYDVVISGPSGYMCNSANSAKAVLTVNPTTVGGIVSSDQTICSGSSPSNLTLAGNVGNVLKWQKSSDAAFSSPVDIAGTSTTLTGATIGSLTSTTYFRAVVQSGVCVAQNSSPVTVTVDPASVGGTASADQVLCSGSQPADISLSGNVGNVVKWQKSTNAAFSSPVDIPVAATTLTGATIGTLSATTYFRAVVKSGVCNPANSNTVSVTVNPIPDVVATPSASTICSQSNLTISLSGSVPNTLFTWVATTGNVTGATSANTTGSSFLNTLATSGPADGTVSYSITPSANGCTGTPVTVNITVKPLPTGTITAGVSGAVSVCVNDAQPQVTFTGGNGTAPYTFTYNINGAAPSYDITTSSGNSVPVNAPTTAAGTFNYNLVAVRDATTVGCSQTASGTAVVTIKPLPTVTSAVSATICSGTAQNYSITSGLGGTTYSWSRGTVAGISNAAVNNQTANPITETLVNTTGAAIIVPYTIIPSSNGCQGAPFTYNLTVNPVATLTLNSGAGSNNPSVCVTTPLTTSITYLVAGTTNTPTVTGLPAGLTSSYNSGTKIFTISGTPTASGSFGYTVSVVGVCGNGTAMGTITVNPAAVGGTTARTTGTPFVCSGSNSGVINLSGQTGNVLKWQSSINAGQTWTDISNTGTSQPFTNLTATTAYRAVLATTSCPSLVAYSTATTVSVVPATGPGSLAVVQLHPFICTGSDTLTALGLGGGSDVGALTGGEFDNAGSQLDGPGKWRKTLIANWNPQDKVNIEASTNNTDNSAFNLTNGPKTFLGTGGCAAVTMNNDPLGGQPNSTKFMATVGPNTSSLESPIFSLAGLTTASMDWWEYFALRAGASIKIELSFDGGSTYTTTLKTITGSTGDTTHGQPNNFTPATLNLDAYVGLNNLRIKFTYTGTACSLWGLEKATITKGSAPATYTWAQVIPTPSGGNPPDHHLNVFQNPTVIVTPPSPNTTDTPQIYTYSIASSAGGCLSNITVTVNPVLVTSATNGNGPLCSGSTMSAISLNANVTGTSFTWTRTNGDLTTGNVTGLAASGIGNTIPSATLVNTTTSPQTVTFTITPTNANACSPAPFTTSLTVNPNPSIVLSGSQNICGPGVQIVNVKSNGPFPINFTLSNGQAVTLVSKDSNIVLNPAITTPGNNSVSITAMSTSSCAAAPYSGTASIIVSPGTTKPIGTWVGTAPCGGSGSDWFNPCNWGSGVIPTLSIDVTIDQTAQCNPVIDPTTSYALANGPIALARNITISGNSRNLSFSNGGELDIAGNWLNNTGVTGFTANTGTVAFVGSAAQSIKTVGSSETFYNLVINNTSAPAVGVTLLSNVNVTHTLTLTNGIVNTKSVPPSGSSNGLGLLTLKSTVTPIAGNPGVTSFINGQLAKEFTNSGISSEYIYPVGKIVNGTPTYKGMAVQPTTTSGTTTFTVEYFPTAHPVPTVILGVGLVGTVPEYWQVDRSGGTADARIKIPYQDPGSGNWLGNNNTTVPDPCSACNVAVVRKDASSNGWDFTKSAGNFNTSDPESRFYQDNGFIYSGSVSSFGPFTNGYAYFVILPVQLLTFESKLSNGDADLTWTIDNPEELAGFEVEYSRDGRNYTKLADIAGDATTEYGYTHSGISAGSNYYRLIVKDKKGTAFYSKTLLIVMNRDISVIKGMRPTMVQNNAVLDIYSAQTQTVRAILLDVSGRTLAQYKMNLVKGENSLVINAIMLVQGYYTLHIMTDDGAAANLRFMKE